MLNTHERQGGAPQRVRDVNHRIIPVGQINVTATAMGSAQTLFTAPESEVIQFVGFSVTNATGTAATLSLHAVPDGGSASTANKVLDAFNVPANTTLSPLSLLGSVYPSKTTFEVYSDTNGALNVRGGVEAHR